MAIRDVRSSASRAAAAKTTTVMAMPSAKGLFHRAIAQSGAALTGVSRADATATTARQQALRARAQRLLQLAQEGTGREQSDGLAKSLLRAALQPFAEFTRELQMLLALCVDVRLEGGSPEAAPAQLASRLVVTERTAALAAGRVLERLQLGEVAVRLLLQQAGMGGIGNQDPLRFHGGLAAFGRMGTIAARPVCGLTCVKWGEYRTAHLSRAV